MATATLLYVSRKHWSGTLICLFQAAEEIAYGAKAMVNNGLYKNVPIPTIVLGQHLHTIKAGVVALSGDPILTAVDSFEVPNFCKSEHISRPDSCVDPIITAAHIVVRLQSIVTEERRPEDFAVMACASIYGGSTANTVPDFVDIKVSIRPYRPEVHERLVAAVNRVLRPECEASGSLAVHEPVYRTIMHRPATVKNMHKAAVRKAQFK